MKETSLKTVKKVSAANPRNIEIRLKGRSGNAQTFSFRASEAISVQFTGDFTHWQERPINLREESGGVWRASVVVPSGAHQYRFLVDGQWHDDPEIEADAANPSGGQNATRQVEERRQPANKDSLAGPRPSALDELMSISKSTADLRVAGGKISADRVAKIYGVSLSRLASWLGRSRQAVSKTPDAESLQNGLSFFERVARLRTVLAKDDFLKWLRMRNRELDDKQPLEFLAKGEGQVVADLVDDMLTGAPA